MDPTTKEFVPNDQVVDHNEVNDNKDFINNEDVIDTKEATDGPVFSHKDVVDQALPVEKKAPVHFALRLPHTVKFLPPVNLKIKIGHYEFNVHGQLVASMSNIIRDQVNAETKETTVIDLYPHKPDVVVRMLMHCYYERYPVSPDYGIPPGAKTVTQVMAENFSVDSASSSAAAFERPLEPKFDPVLHLEVNILAHHLEMKYLAEYSLKRVKRTLLGSEGEAFWPCVEIINNLEDAEIADNLERKLVRLVEGRIWATKKSFADLEVLRPSMAAQISAGGKTCFFGRRV